MKALACLGSALILIFSLVAGAQQGELVDRSFAGTSKAKTPQEARQSIQDEAAKNASEELIKELIGEERFQKNRSTIQSKIVRQSSKYIPYMRPSQLRQVDDEFNMSVEMKISLRDLKQLLQQNALLSATDDIPVVLPMISITDRVQGSSYRWWNPSEREDQSFLVKETRLVEDSLRTAFQKNGFYSLKPVDAGLSGRVPQDFKNERINTEDAQFFAQYFEAPLLVDGVIQLQRVEGGRNYRIEIRMTATQVSNGRAIADVSRRFDTESGPFERVVDTKLKEVFEGVASDLSSQVLEAWQRGSVGTSLIRLTLQGRGTPATGEMVKEKIRSQVTQVKSIRERMVTADVISFELDTSVSASELVGRIEALDFEGKKLSKVSEGRDEIVLQWAR